MAQETTSDWYIVLTEPQQEITTVWRMHELGLELFTPIVRERRPTRHRNQHGQKICVLKPKPMFPGYGFVRQAGIADLNAVLKVRGVRDVLRWQGKPVLLPHAAVMAVHAKQQAEHQQFMREKGGRVSKWKVGARVRVDEGNVYAGMVAEIEKLKGVDRIVVLLGMAKIRHELPADMVVAA